MPFRIGIVSDSHGERENLRRAAELLRRDWNVELFAHLGDECEDAEVLKETGLEVLQVPGVFCSHYRDPAVPNRVLKELAGWRLLFTHTSSPHENDLPGDLNPQELAATGAVDVVAFGHTHIPELRLTGDVLWLNPGHLKESDKKGYPPSFAILELGEWVRVFLVDLGAGEVFARGELGAWRRRERRPQGASR